MPTRSIPWSRLLVEGVVIILSILLAFGIDAWWDDRQATAQRGVALTNLGTALEQSLEAIDRNQAEVGDWQSRLLTFTRLGLDTIDSVPPDTAAVLVEAVVRPVIDDFKGGVIIEMLADDRLDEVEGAAWHAAVAEWRNWWQVLRERQESIYQIERQVLIALGRDESTQVAANMGLRSAIQLLGHREEVPIGPDALRGARGNPEVMALAYAKVAHYDALQLIQGFLRTQGETLWSQVQVQLQP